MRGPSTKRMESITRDNNTNNSTIVCWLSRLQWVWKGDLEWLNIQTIVCYYHILFANMLLDSLIPGVLRLSVQASRADWSFCWARHQPQSHLLRETDGLANNTRLSIEATDQLGLNRIMFFDRFVRVGSRINLCSALSWRCRFSMSFLLQNASHVDGWFFRIVLSQ